MARAAPSAEGWVMWQASADMPKPTISAWMRAPRARAASSGSSTSMAAAFAQNHAAAVLGKRPAGLRRHHAHGFPGFQNAETEGRFAAAGEGQVGDAVAHHPVRLPDGVGRRGAGRRDGEAGPGDAEFHGDVAGAGVRHGLGNGQRVHAVVAQLVDFLEADIFGALAAHAGAGDDGRGLAQCRRPLDAGVCHGFARGDHRELREAVHEVRAAVVEVRLVAVVLALRRRSESATGRRRWIRSGRCPAGPGARPPRIPRCSGRGRRSRPRQ